MLTRHASSYFSAPCQSGWTYFRGVCYSLVTESLPWLRAEARCYELKGAQLVYVTSSDVNSVVHNLVNWSGLSVWQAGFSVFRSEVLYFSHDNYNNWFGGNRPPFRPGDLICPLIDTSAASQWRTAPCEQNPGFPFVCQQRKFASCPDAIRKFS